MWHKASRRIKFHIAVAPMAVNRSHLACTCLDSRTLTPKTQHSAGALRGMAQHAETVRLLLSMNFDSVLAACPRLAPALYPTARALLHRLLATEAQWLPQAPALLDDQGGRSGARASDNWHDVQQGPCSAESSVHHLEEAPSGTNLPELPMRDGHAADICKGGHASAVCRHEGMPPDWEAMRAGPRLQQAVLAVCECGRSQVVVPRFVQRRTASDRARCRPTPAAVVPWHPCFARVHGVLRNPHGTAFQCS